MRERETEQEGEREREREGEGERKRSKSLPSMASLTVSHPSYPSEDLEGSSACRFAPAGAEDWKHWLLSIMLATKWLHSHGTGPCLDQPNKGRIMRVIKFNRALVMFY